MIGNPGVGSEIFANAVSRGVMSAETTLRGKQFFQMGISINAGNSGGPVMDSTGKVIGMATLKADKNEGIAFCIPVAEIISAMRRASDLTPADIDEVNSRFRAETTVRLLRATFMVYEKGLDFYATTMETAIRNGISADDGLKAASNSLENQIKPIQKMLVAFDVKSNVSRLSADRHIRESVRDKIVDFWTTLSEMRDYFDNPRGNVASFRNKTTELCDKGNRLYDGLSVSLSIAERDD